MKKFVLIFLVFLLGCNAVENVRIAENQVPSLDPVSLCIEECKKELSNGRDLGNGPCLSNEIMLDWVCDVTHNPREDIDNIEENQCSSFREGKAKHFVEVDTNCKFIKKF